MKNLKKVLAVMTAVSAMAATTSAFAANEATVSGTNITGSYVNVAAEGETPVYKLDVALNGVTADDAKDKTLLVLKEGAGETVEDSEILYIDQGTEAFEGLGLKAITVGEGEDAVQKDVIDFVTTDAAGHNIIKIGYYDADGNFAIAQGTLAVTEIVEDTKTITFNWGDTTLDGSVDVSDVLATIYYGAGDVRSYSQAGSEDSYTVGEPYGDIKWGDTTLDGSVDVSDVLAAIYYGAGDVRTYETYTVGQPYTVEVE